MRLSAACCLLGCVLLLTACGQGTADESAAGDVATWTLEENLRIDEEADYYLGSVRDVAVRADGTLLVADSEEYHIKVISPEGELLEMIGRQGQGPGEFQGIGQLALARGDSLYVWNPPRRLSVFAPASYELVRMVQLPGSPDGRRFPGQLMVPPEEGFLVSYAVPIALGGDADPALVRIGENGERLGLVEIPLQGQERIRTVAYKHVMNMNVPFERHSVVAMGPEGRLYHGNTDSLAITISDLDGHTLDRWILPAKPRPVAEADVRAAVESNTAWVDEAVRGPVRQAVHEALREAGLPDTQPAFYDLLVDDRQRVWIRRDAGRAETATWWVASAEGELLAELTLPGNVDLTAVRDGYTYGTLSGHEALPTVIRYRIEAMSSEQ